MSSCNRLVVVLIRPSRYDDEGYVVRHWRGTLPSNTLSTLHGLTAAVASSGTLGTTEVRVRVLDEAVDRIVPDRIARPLRRAGTKVVVALAGVQTNQFPRAVDLARACRAAGCDVMIGGFHVSGSIALGRGMLPPELTAAMDAGITLVAGEVEEHWAALLAAAAQGRLERLYNFLEARPHLGRCPLPKVDARLQRKFAVRGYGTIDAGRGCPFDCSFCTIIHVQGRTMRSRNAEAIVDHVRQHARGRPRIHQYFFTDDNFSRNPIWEATFDGLIALRRDEGIAIEFMMQVDTAASRLPNFTAKAAAAGCVQVFMGVESIRADNLLAANKRQNRAATYRESIVQWHDAGVVCHAGFIIGFPYDTYERVLEDVRTLRDDLCVDQASFFMLTPLPGSRDHQAALDAGVPLDPDYNNFDSFHATAPHARMRAAEWKRAYDDAWTMFYTTEHMRAALQRQPARTYWSLLKVFVWYRASMIEGAHPMVTGFFRLKDRRSRRPGWPLETRSAFLARRVREIAGALTGYARLCLEMEELWRTSRSRRRVAVTSPPRRPRRSDSLLGLAWTMTHDGARMASFLLAMVLERR